MNGREWLAKQLEKEKISYLKQDNCFLKIGNLEKANDLMQKQVSKDFPRILNKIVNMIIKPVKAI